jgi:ribonuclease J
VGIPKENIAVLENGYVIEFQGGKMMIGERLPGGYIFVDGSGVGDVGPSVVRERDTLARDGVVFVDILTDANTGDLIENPYIITKGFVYQSESRDLLEETREYIESEVARANGNLREDLESGLRNFFYRETKRRPMIFVVVNSVN